ncbi:MAG: NADH-quinone oxidoreductase subunit NuoG, partial [Pseudomonadales bacterium]
MAIIEIDGQSFEVQEGQNLLQACLTHKKDLPYFCWHPAMGSVGACRQCAVIQYQDEDDQRGRLVMACMTPVADGARISIEAGQAKDFRASVIEWLMENHPHDCPVCEEGGECHLQDMTVMTGHTTRRYRGQKRTFRNQYLGPFVGHEMNRCITCFRCVRYYQDYAGGRDLQAFGSRARMFFGRESDGVLENEFAGNLVEVCPTGVFTDKPFSQTYTRKWDLQSAPSICPGCAVGCNVLPGERYGELKRIHNRYHPDVNGYFLCDRGRFGSHFVNSDKRVRRIGVRAEDGVFEEVGDDDANARLAAVLAQGDVIGIGSPRASLEANFALKSLVGEDSFVSGVADSEQRLNELMVSIYREGGAHIATLTDVEAADAVLVLGEDVSNTAPRIALALRQSVRNLALDMAAAAGIPEWQDAGVRGHAQDALNPLCLASITPTRIDDIAAHTLRGTPEALGAAGFAIAHQIDNAFAAVASDDGETGFIGAAAKALSEAKRPLIVSGTGCGSAAVMQAAANIAWALQGQGAEAALLLTGQEANSTGVTLLGANLDLSSALQKLSAGDAKNLIVLENDLYRRAPAASVDAALDKADNVIVLDILETPTLERASMVLPAAAYAESTGTFVNYEGRAQRFYQVFEPEGATRPAWRYLADAAQLAGRNDIGWNHVDEVVQACAATAALSGIADVAPTADFRGRANQRIPRETHRVSGRTAEHAHLSVHEPKTTVDDETPLAFSMEGLNADQPGSLIPYVWSPGWNSNQSVFKFQQEVAGSLQGGEVGVRLLDVPPNKAGLQDRFRQTTRAGSESTAGMRLLPLFSIFGSDELSSFSPPIDERSSGPQLFLNRGDAAQLGLTE